MNLNQSEVKKLGSKKDQLELAFLSYWKILFPQLQEPVRQFRHNPERKWRWDFALLPYEKPGILVDIQGGTFIKGGHSRGVGQDRDYEKWNDAVRMGYRPLLFGTKAMDHPEDVVTYVAEVLTNAH